MITKDELYPIGKFQKTHALKGELNMILDIDPKYFLEGNPMIIDYDGIYVPYYTESIRQKGATSHLVKIAGISTEQEASGFVNKEIYILKNDAEEWLGEELEETDAYTDYIVEDSETGQTIGRIIAIDESTVNELFIIEDETGEEIIIPANEELIEEIDDEGQIIKMHLPEGILTINRNEKE